MSVYPGQASGTVVVVIVVVIVINVPTMGWTTLRTRVVSIPFSTRYFGELLPRSAIRNIARRRVHDQWTRSTAKHINASKVVLGEECLIVPLVLVVSLRTRSLRSMDALGDVLLNKNIKIYYPKWKNRFSLIALERLPPLKAVD